MSTDNNGDSRPTVSDIVKANHLVPGSKEKSASTADVGAILSQEGVPPQETFFRLSEIQIPEDHTQPVESPTPKKIDIVDTSQQDQQQAEDLSQRTKAEAAKLTEPTVETPPNLFPDRPSLYEQHHEKYDQEIRTIKGQITRIKDVLELKKAGVKKARYTYDGLRSRGITRDQIMKNDTGELPRISRILKNDFLDSDKAREYQKITYYTDLPLGIERLYSIGQFDSNLFSSDKDFSQIEITTSLISNKTEKEFKQLRDQLNQFHFLSDSYVLQFFYGKELPKDTFDALLYLKKEYFSDTRNETKLDLSLSSQNISKNNLFNGLNREGYNKGIGNLVKALTMSDIKDDRKIDIPKELHQFANENETAIFNCLSNLVTRDQQRFLIEQMSFYTYSNKDLEVTNYYFDTNFQPNINFYHDFISSIESSDTAVTIPKSTLESIEDQSLRNFYETMSTLPEYQFQKYFLIAKDRGDNISEYIHEGQLNFEFYKNLLSDPNIQIVPIPAEHLSNLSEEDQKNISFISRTKPNTLRLFMLQNYKDIDLFIKNNQLTPLFFERILETTVMSSLNTETLRSDLTPEVLASFSPEKQKMWNGLLNLGDIRVDSIIRLIKSDIDPYLSFDKDNNPTAFFLKECINKKLIDITDTNDNLFNRSLEILTHEENYQFLVDILNNQKDPDMGGFILGRIFQSSYQDQNKRIQTPISLCAWRIYRDNFGNDSKPITTDNLKELIAKINSEISKKNRYIQNSELDLPKGLRVSMGTEIEIMLNGIFRTSLVNKDEIIDYKQLSYKNTRRPSAFVESFLEETKQKINSAKFEYRTQVRLVSLLGVGYGKDAVHEFANEPVTNYAVLLWELSEISKLGFIDFDRKLLQNIERGMHLTISGDKEGIKLDENANLLQNALSVSGFSSDGLDAIGASEIVDTVADESTKLYKQVKGYILQRDSLKTKIFDDSMHAAGVENRSFRIGSFNHLARTLLYSSRLAVPLKAYQQYEKLSPQKNQEYFLSNIKKLIDQGQSLEQITEQYQGLLPEYKNEKLAKSIIIWAYFRSKTVDDFNRRQSNTSRYRLNSPLDKYSNRDMTRLGAELLHTYGGIDENGVKIPDSLKLYHEKSVDPDSLPERQRKTIIESSNAVWRLFKKQK